MKTVKQMKTTTVAKAVALTLGVLSASAAMAGTVPVPAFDLGLLKNFNIVANNDIHVRTSDMQCGAAAVGNFNIYGGYSIGKSSVEAKVNGTTVVTTYPKAPLGILLGANLKWGSHITAKNPAPIAPPFHNENPASGTINGDVFFGSNLGSALIAPDAAVTLTPPAKLYNLTTAIADTTTVYNLSVAGFAPSTVPSLPFPSNNVAQNLTSVAWLTASAFASTWFGNPALPATGTTTARTFYNAASPASWPVVAGEARYNIDLTDVIGDTTRGIGAAPTPWAGNQLYVFDVDADKLSQADVVRLNNVRNFEDTNSDNIRVPAIDKSSWVVIRVNATAPTVVRFGNMGMQDLAGMASRTLWVFSPNVTKIQIGGTSFEGSILAPGATVESLNGQFNGTMFVNYFQGPAWASGQLPQPKAFADTAMSIPLTTYPGTLEGHCAVFEPFPGGVLYTP